MAEPKEGGKKLGGRRARDRARGFVQISVRVPLEEAEEFRAQAQGRCERRDQHLAELEGQGMMERVYAVPYGEESEFEALAKRLRQEQQARAAWVEDRLHEWVKAQPRMPTMVELDRAREHLRVQYNGAERGDRE